MKIVQWRHLVIHQNILSASPIDAYVWILITIGTKFAMIVCIYVSKAWAILKFQFLFWVGLRREKTVRRISCESLSL